jgi:hypothetical protein
MTIKDIVQHSPLPWSIWKGDVAVLIQSKGDTRYSDNIASVYRNDPNGNAKLPVIQNADLIVQAVNAHPALVAALTDVRDFLKRSGYDTRLVDAALAGRTPPEQLVARNSILVQTIQATINTLQALLDHPDPQVVIQDWVGGTIAKLESIVETEAALVAGRTEL